MRCIDKNIARVHVGVEEAVVEYLREENLHASLGQCLHIDPSRIKRGDIANGNT